MKEHKQGLEKSHIKDPSVPRYIKKLRICKNIPEQEMVTIYTTFNNNIKTAQQLMEVRSGTRILTFHFLQIQTFVTLQFLSYLPESNGGLYPVAVGLFHKSTAGSLCSLLI